MTYENLCGPVAVASAMGVNRREAACLLRAYQQPTRERYTQITTIGRVLGRPVEEPFKPDVWLNHQRKSHWPKRQQPIWLYTLTQWLKAFNDREAVLRASYHFVHVKDGEIVEANKIIQPRARVTHVVFID